jgi:hypothetical protein
MLLAENDMVSDLKNEINLRVSSSLSNLPKDEDEGEVNLQGPKMK